MTLTDSLMSCSSIVRPPQVLIATVWPPMGCREPGFTTTRRDAAGQRVAETLVVDVDRVDRTDTGCVRRGQLIRVVAGRPLASSWIPTCP